jgi:hydrogenase/urease accessory protein HupE
LPLVLLVLLLLLLLLGVLVALVAVPSVAVAAAVGASMGEGDGLEEAGKEAAGDSFFWRYLRMSSAWERE